MRSYHARSYSEQARKMSDHMFYKFFLPLLVLGAEINDAENYVIKAINESYRHKLVKERAAARFGKKVREYKKKER
jgi:hypothetical protein